MIDVLEFKDAGGKSLFFHYKNLNTETLETIQKRVSAILAMRLPLYVAENEEQARCGAPLCLDAFLFPTPALERIRDAAATEVSSRKNRVLNADLDIFNEAELQAIRERLDWVISCRKPKSPARKK